MSSMHPMRDRRAYLKPIARVLATLNHLIVVPIVQAKLAMMERKLKELLDEEKEAEPDDIEKELKL